jgi:GAF domain-containing protein
MAAYTDDYVQGLLAENERLRTLVESLTAESEAQVANLASLYVAVTSVHDALDRPSVLSSVQEIVTNLIGSEELAIFEIDGAHGRLTLLASTGIEPGPYQEIYVGDGAIGRAAATGERLIRQEGGSLTEDGDAALTACIPLKVAGRVLGVLAVFRLLPHKGRLDAIDIDLFDVLAAHAASALLFTRLYAASDGIVGATA